MSPAQYYAQFGEDRILRRIFGDRRHGLCVEVGANDGFHGSNTLFFEQAGWDCILVEPNPQLCESMRSFRKAMLFEVAASDRDGTATLQVATGGLRAHAVSTLDEDAGMRTLHAHGFESVPLEVRTRRLDGILADVVADRTIDFMSIDVEGHELAVLAGFSLPIWRPRIMIIERNGGTAGRAVAEHMRRNDYVRFRRSGVNDWYARTDDRELGTALRQALYYPSVSWERLKATAFAAKLAARRVPGVLPIWHLVRRLRPGRR